MTKREGPKRNAGGFCCGDERKGAWMGLSKEERYVCVCGGGGGGGQGEGPP